MSEGKVPVDFKSKVDAKMAEVVGDQDKVDFEAFCKARATELHLEMETQYVFRADENTKLAAIQVGIAKIDAEIMRLTHEKSLVMAGKVHPDGA